MMLCGSIGPPFKVASAWGEAAHVLEGFKIPGRKLAADAVTSPALIRSRREIPPLFMALLLFMPDAARAVSRLPLNFSWSSERPQF